MRNGLIKLLTATLLLVSLACQASVKVVAAENMYGELAKLIGGNLVEVKSILTNPNQDPHLFTATPDVAKQIADAQIIVYNGAGYDTWLDQLLTAHKKDEQQVIKIASLVRAAPGANPHLWYQPQTMLVYAQLLANTLSKLDSNNHVFYQQQLAYFQHDYLRLTNKINSLRQKYKGIPVIATEPVFQYMADALGLKMCGLALQQSMMNDVEPSPKQIKEFETLLRSRYVKVMFYNKQVVSPFAKHLQQLAIQNNIPVVAVSEMQPTDKGYIDWMLDQLIALDKALQNVDNSTS